MASIANLVSGIARKIVPPPVRDFLRPYWNRVAPPSVGELRAQEIEKVGPAQRWATLQTDEIDYWDKVLASVRMSPDKLVQDYLTALIDARVGSRVEILDVGAGPLTFLGKKWEGRDVHITALDPNAPEYDRLLTKHRIQPPCRTQFGYVEDLSSVIPLSSFDLVHARNCIDHSKDPLHAISEMVRAAKPGCCVFLNHLISEGRRNQYSGPHQWNLFPRRGRFYVDRPGMRPIDVGEEIREIANVAVGPSPDGAEWFSVTIRRHPTPAFKSGLGGFPV